jgi:hypothetical protein
MTSTSTIQPTLQILARRIACIELFTTQAITDALRTLSFTNHPVTAELLSDLAQLHTRHAGALARHLSVLEEKEMLSAEPSDGLENNRPATMAEADEVLIWAYTRLNLLAAHYTRLHALAGAAHDKTTAEIALDHLRAITPRIMACSQALPRLAVRVAETRLGELPADAADAALEATQAAWKNNLEPPATS